MKCLGALKNQHVINEKGFIDNVVRRLIPLCIKCLYELLKQKVISEKVHDYMHMDDTVRKLVWKRFQVNKVNG